MKIRLAHKKDIKKIAKIYSDARAFMQSSGNKNQWINGYPDISLIEEDIENDRLYLLEDGTDILAVFVYFFGEDATYKKIYEGKWLNDKKYGVIHRIAVAENAHGKGVSAICFDFAFKKCANLKIDTHKDNIPMQKALLKFGFKYCGIIYLENGSDRLAYQKAEN